MAEEEITQEAAITGLIDYARHGDGDEDVKLLLKMFPNIINSQDECGRTAVHFAAANGHISTLGILLAEKPNLAVPNDEGNTALHWAAACGQAATCEALLKAGADPTRKNLQGKSPIDECRLRDDFEQLELLLLKYDTTQPSAAQATQARRKQQKGRKIYHRRPLRRYNLPLRLIPQSQLPQLWQRLCLDPNPPQQRRMLSPRRRRRMCWMSSKSEIYGCGSK
eukprot:NODE_1390_length_881_cov_12.583554_g1344_i0.p1 GENE.NODE_1390_length_881_cov_12.583554_g1344_i0~~NODE_1390_length_881_cov_12.583554_g1344_i0.p1  ORF type:complete len:242 (+),score=47.01 NODE_1390_length_881_cov_12.583554_g1344_i0:58-726(+)